MSKNVSISPGIKLEFFSGSISKWYSKIKKIITSSYSQEN